MTVTKVAQAGLSLTEAFSGVLQTNANFVDQVIFGPAVDGRAWNGLWNKASVFSSLMLATIEDEGSNTEINIWDLTQQSAGSPSTTVLATVDLSAAATPTAIAASMGYLIVSSEDGIAIIDPHSGAWAERTVGWPRTLSTSTVPALTDNDVQAVAARPLTTAAYDPRTGGPMPTFVIGYGTGADAVSVLKTDGNVFDRAGTSGNAGVAIWGDRAWYALGGTGDILNTCVKIDTITADDWTQFIANASTEAPQGLGCENAASFEGDTGATASDLGLTVMLPSHPITGSFFNTSNAIVNRTYNSGFLLGDIRGAWLANSKTVDRSFKANTLTENGTVTEAAVASGSELLGYSGFTSSNYFSRAHDADLDFGTTFSVIGWFKTTGTSSTEYFFERKDPSDTARQFRCSMFTSGNIEFEAMNAAANLEFSVTSSISRPLDDSLWHQIAMWRDGTNAYMYIDGVLVASDSEAITDTHVDSNATLAIGNSVATSGPATTTTLALWRFSATVPTASQVRQMYEAEKGMFVASAECLLQSGSTDAVIDVDVDPLTSKVIVTQTDAITIFDGLVVDSKPTVNSGASEKGKLWGALRAEQNAANAYVTAPAVDQRQVNEMVRGLASDLPAGVDLSKAKAWLVQTDNSTTGAIGASYNIKSLTRSGVGVYEITFATPFKSDTRAAGGDANVNYASIFSGNNYYGGGVYISGDGSTRFKAKVNMTDLATPTNRDSKWSVVFFGELENE